MNLRILVLSRYDKLGASSRLRTLQYIPKLEELGAQVTVAALFDEAYLLSLYQSKNWVFNRSVNLITIAKLYFNRLLFIINNKKFDIIWVEKELFPFLPSVFEFLLVKSGVPYIVDYDDAIFHKYDLNRSQLIRFFLGEKLKPLISNAYAITVGNTYLANYAIQNGAKNVVIIPTVIDLNRYSVSSESIDNIFRVGWIGSPSSAKYLPLIAESLRIASKSIKLIFVTIGTGALDMPGVHLEQHDWSLNNEVKLLQSIHVGVMPLLDSPWERGKCGYKLIQYMACGKAVIASPVGANLDIVTSDVGILANDDNSWFDAFIQLARQPALRQQLGQAGRIRVEQEFSLQVTTLKIMELFEKAVRERY